MTSSLPPGTADAANSAATRHRVAAGLAQSGERLDRLLAAALPEVSRSRVQALIAAGHVSSGGRTIGDASARVKPGQTFDIIIPEPAPAEPLAQAIDLAIVYEDDDLLVVDKPAGLVVHPAPGNPDKTLVNALLAHCAGRLSGIGGVQRPGIVHRLDKDTSGLMVVAKTDIAHAGLSAQFADRTLSRTYLAVVDGVPAKAAGEIDAPIGRSPRNRKKMAVVRRGGKPALTRYRVVRRLGGERRSAASLVECTLATGRTHQIRVHLASIGHPVIGDPLYRGRRADLPEDHPSRRFPRQALHAAALRFVHPRDGEPRRFASDLPADMTVLIEELE
ncbi:MAG: RluA family pseudouridine synthase [Inquilinus sp.]|nr:RluA family pseudouridine synthase [Inquilinus sp.]